MTSRAQGWRQMLEENEEDTNTESLGLEPHLLSPITPELIDEAVNLVQTRVPTDSGTAEALRATMRNDVDSMVAHSMYNTRAALDRAALATIARTDLWMPYALDDKDVKSLTRYAPEFKLNFRHVVSHDHAMAAACRKIDTAIIAARLPQGVPFSDIGGNPMVYINNAMDNWHVCGGDLDPKDAKRWKERNLEAKRIVSKGGTNHRRVQLAKRFLASDKTLVCGDRAELCDVQTPVGVAIHVYDIPMEHWPIIMERKGLQIVEGCLLFSDLFFEEKSGVLGVSKSRYEIDTTRDTFMMGFEKSPGWWYQHKWSEFVLYGTDQLILGTSANYSYRVIERRGDTIFFRIIKISRLTEIVDMQQTFSYPEIPVVVVNGFELSHTQSDSTLIRRDYRFPKTIWCDLMNQAAEDFERGVLDFQKMYNHYRTMSVRQTINSVLVMGDNKVPLDMQVALVVHACLAAAASSLLGQRTTRGITDSITYQRNVINEATIEKVARLTSVALSSAVQLLAAPLLLPIRALFDAVKNKHAKNLLSKLVEWAPEWEYTTIPVNVLFRFGAFDIKVYRESEAKLAVHKYDDDDMHDDDLVAIAKHPDLGKALFNLCPDGDSDTDSDDEELDESSKSDSMPPTYVTKERDDEISSETRCKNAILEHINEINLTSEAVADGCQRTYRELTSPGLPKAATLLAVGEGKYNPDFWRVAQGVIVESMLGIPTSDFDFSAVYYPDDTGDAKAGIVPVYRRDYKDKDTGVVTIHNVIENEYFNGWVLVTDHLKIYNGPDIVSTMKQALDLKHKYSIEIIEGVPGCGKTYDIVRKAPADNTAVITCPVRESIEDTRKEFVKLNPKFRNPKMFIRTIDSYLKNREFHKPTKKMQVDELYVDECYMTHAGKIHTMAALLNVKKVYAYGDSKQIPHTPRVEAPCMYTRLYSLDISYQYINRRNPAKAVAAFAHVYNYKVRSVSQIEGVYEEVHSTEGMEVPDGCVMMTMLQADKLELKKRYARYLDKVKFLTAHESEGKTFDHVWLHKLDTRMRTDGQSLFDKQSYCLVAASRHRRNFYFVNAGTTQTGGLLSRWVEASNDPRRVNAVRDVESVGTEIEML